MFHRVHASRGGMGWDGIVRTISTLTIKGLLNVPVTAEPQLNGDVTAGDSSVASTPLSQRQQIPAAPATASPWLDDEPVVKSPPEPTRVKSPEQMIMRSPEPVNWTVPLDTGKTFTVTQNVREGRYYNLPPWCQTISLLTISNRFIHSFCKFNRLASYF